MSTQQENNPNLQTTGLNPNPNLYREDSDSKLAPDHDSLKSKIERSAASVKEKYGEASSAAARTLREGKERARYKASDLSSKMRSNYDERRDQVKDSFQRNPLAYSVGAFAIGFLVGLALPKSRREDRLIGEQSEKLHRKGEELAAQAKVATQEALQSAKRTFEDRVQGERDEGQI